MKITVSKLISNIHISLFFIVIFFLTRQFPFSQYSIIMNVALIIFFIVTLYFSKKNFDNNLIKVCLHINLIILTIMIMYSLYILNEPSNILRFYLILTLLVLSYFLNVSFELIKYFLFLMILHALIIIGLEVYLILNFNLDNYLPIRLFFKERGWGDIYSFNGIIWNIQLKGNALLPFAFFVSLIYFDKKKYLIVSLLFFISSILSGNFAFILGISLFMILYALYIIKWTREKILIYFTFLFIFTIFFTGKVVEYVDYKIEQKSMESNAIRIDQYNVLIDDLTKSSSGVFFGQGLGNLIEKKTKFRDYAKDIYYELQSLYFFNQMGTLYFFIFFISNIILAIYFIKYKLLLISYFSYLFYSFFNPYFLDTNHIVVIVVLLSLRKVLDEKNIFYTRSI